MHVFEKRYETVTYPDAEGWAEGWGGFAARVLVNPSGAELRHETKLFVEYRNGGAEAEDAYWQYVAPRIPEWNLELRQEDGGTLAIAPPAEKWESIYEVEPSVIAWLALVIHTAHLPNARARMQGITEASPNDAGISDTTPPTNPSRLNSSTPSASTSVASA
jgi:hypothetical protein